SPPTRSPTSRPDTPPLHDALPISTCVQAAGKHYELPAPQEFDRPPRPPRRLLIIRPATTPTSRSKCSPTGSSYVAHPGPNTSPTPPPRCPSTHAGSPTVRPATTPT